MKTLDPNTTETFCKLIEKMQGKGHLKIESEPFMPLYIEKLAEGIKMGKYENGALYSLAPYYILNGDLMSDPEMTFIVVISEKGISEVTEVHILPCSYAQADMGIYEESVTFLDQNAREYHTELQEKHTEFANVWLSNIRDQRFSI